MGDVAFHTRNGLLKGTLSALLTWLETEFEAYGEGSLKVVLVRNLADMRQPSRNNKQRASEEAPVYGEEQKDTVEYPLMRIALGDISIDGERAGFNKKYALGRGIPIGLNKEEGYAYKDTLIPVKVSLGARFDTADLEHLLVLVSTIFHAIPKITFTFLTETGTVPIDCSVNFDPSMTIPQADMSNPGDPYTLETTFTLNTYIGNITKQPIVKGIQVTFAHPEKRSDPITMDKTKMSIYERYNVKYYDLFDLNSKHFKYDAR